MSEPDTIIPQIVPRNGETINTDTEDTEKHQVYELVNSGSESDEYKRKFTENKAYGIHAVKRKKNRYIWITIIGAVVVVILFSVCIALHCKQHSKSPPSYSKLEQESNLQPKSNVSLKTTVSCQYTLLYAGVVPGVARGYPSHWNVKNYFFPRLLSFIVLYTSQHRLENSWRHPSMYVALQL